MELLKSGYLIQTDTISCGPVATLNAEIWQGKSISDSWDVLGPRRKLLNTRYNNFPVRGTLPEDMDMGLVKLGLSYNSTTSRGQMLYELERGNALILLFFRSNQTIVEGCRIKAHYIFVYQEKNRIKIANDERKYFTKWETFEKEYLTNNTHAIGNVYPMAWVVSK